MTPRGTAAVVAGTTGTITALATGGTVETAGTGVAGTTARTIAALATLAAALALTAAGTSRSLGLLEAIQGYLAAVVDLDDLDLDLVANVQNILDLLNAALGNAGDVQQAVLAGQQVHKRAERLDGNNAAGVLLAHLGDLDDELDALDGSGDGLAHATDVHGAVLAYDGQPVFAAFHSSSSGATEDCGAIWNPLPYLISVPSPETADTVPGYVSQVQLSSLDFRDTVLSAYPYADFTGDESSWVGEINLEDSGRVASAILGGVEISGTEIRSLFSLRSTAFTLEYTGMGFLFTVTGYGHGVGMSQYGANYMASQGKNYAEILAVYYNGAQISMYNS